MHGLKTIKQLNDDKVANSAVLANFNKPKSVFGDKGQPKFVPSVK
jgi:hypothetical protein